MSRNTPPHTRRAPHVYDRLASRYDCALELFERRGLARLRAATLRELPEAAHILEVGAGTGANFVHYPAGASGVASELSREMIERARSKPERPRGVCLARARAEQLPFADCSFDAACATLVFCSVTSPREAFAELRRVVRPGGIIALLEHVRPGGVPGYVFDVLNFLTVALLDDHFNRRTADEARGAGLKLLRVESHLFGVMQIIVCRVE